MLTTDFVPGSPCWIDLGAPDVAAAVAFYGAVFGWEAQSFGEEAEGYAVLRVGGRAVGAVGRLTEAGARSAWTVYFNTPDAGAAAEAVLDAGGTVRLPPTDAGKEGRLAQFTDPQGGRFAVWQPGTMPGMELTDEPGSLCWAELYTTDAAAAKRFYGGLFGWRSSEVPMPGGEGGYTLLTPHGLPPERMFGGLLELRPEHLTLTSGLPYWHPVFTVVDCDATVAKVTAQGGTVQMGPVDAPDIGRMAVCVDPAGADFVLLTPPLTPPTATAEA
ncbi:VOC family protein [Kitasatospora sp. NBC_01287]|uniref:VOC family protein n=1 Tax=Kitasatospora sp. NBC_01287 TaxID=2903573 RepID=UPI00225B7E79|nr:VOC family protein [Kitasatospora sp. NBC_01287]MCX4744392.1 VOC family protein [Kitasatospora sp. NBC_01287]